MSRELNPSQIWSQLPVASRTVEVNTKTGFSLTAGSYSVRASSSQRGTVSVAPDGSSATTSISSVTVTRATLGRVGHYSHYNTSNPQLFQSIIQLTNSTTVTLTRGGYTGGDLSSFEVFELF